MRKVPGPPEEEGAEGRDGGREASDDSLPNDEDRSEQNDARGNEPPTVDDRQEDWVGEIPKALLLVLSFLLPVFQFPLLLLSPACAPLLMPLRMHGRRRLFRKQQSLLLLLPLLPPPLSRWMKSGGGTREERKGGGGTGGLSLPLSLSNVSDLLLLFSQLETKLDGRVYIVSAAAGERRRRL